MAQIQQEKDDAMLKELEIQDKLAKLQEMEDYKEKYEVALAKVHEAQDYFDDLV